MALDEYFDKVKNGLVELNGEIAELVEKMKKEEDKKDKKDKKRIISSHSVEPMSRMRKDVGEIKSAEENPEIQFVMDRLGDIFK